jgi:hypothetical protein
MAHADRLTEIAEQLHADKEVSPLTVREFLSWFGAQRRGYSIVEKIRQALNDVKLQTEPDFESRRVKILKRVDSLEVISER